MTYITCLSQIVSKLPTTMARSGHSVFQYGEYQDCLETPHFNYNLISLGIGQVNSGLFMALCLPDKCTQTIIKKSLSSALKLAHLPFNVFSVQSDFQNYQFPYSPLFFFTTFLIISLFLLVIIASCSYKEQSKDIWNSFAIQQSIKIFKRKENSDLNIFNGIRSFSMMWVVIGHTYLMSASTSVNTLGINEIISEPFFLIIEGGLLSVDVFFFLGGFFLAFVFLRQKSKSIWKYPITILQRALRIWPAFIITMLFYYVIFMHLGGGPRWPQMEPLIMICKDMWRSIFFVQNLINNGEQQCLAWGWYLQVDFQIFLVCLMLLSLYNYNKKISAFVSASLVIGSWIYNIVYTQINEQKLFTNIGALMAMQKYFLFIYTKPYGRWSPYIFGLFSGIAYSQYLQSSKYPQNKLWLTQKLENLKHSFQSRKMYRIIFEWTGIGLMAFLVFVPRGLQIGQTWNQILHSLYLCFSRVLFCFGLLMVVLPTLLGIKSSFFRTILDTQLFNFLAKISFCVYLVHYIVITQVLASKTYDFYYYLPDVFTQYQGILFLSCFFGFLMTITVEIPFSVLQKQLFKSLLKRNSKKKTTSIQHQAIQSKPINTSLLKINDSLIEQK